MNWGNRILITYLAFAALMIGLVTIAMQQKDIFLVDKEYYKEELAYQTKIDQISNANGLSIPVEYAYEGNQLRVLFPKRLVAVRQQRELGSCAAVAFLLCGLSLGGADL
jgi:predicted RND superfamily exporter protein